MARILHVITGLGTGGAEVMLWKLLSTTRGRHSQVVVSLMNQGTIGPRIAGLGVPVYDLGLRSRPNPVRAFALRSIAGQFDPQLIVGWMYHGNLAASFAAAGRRSRIPVVWGIHQSLYSLSTHPWLTAAVIRLDARLSGRAAAIVYVSQISRKQHEAFGYHAAAGLVIPNGIECREFIPDENARASVRAELGLAENNALVGLVARCHPMKDHPGFLRAAELVARSHPAAKFVLIGRGVQEDAVLRTLIRETQLQNRVLLLGERQDMPRITAGLDIACSASSRDEAFSVAVAEAMACGIPCVVTDVGDSAFIVGDTGLTVPPRNPEALADAIGQLIAGGPERRRELGAAARSRIESRFSLAAVACSYEELYRKHLPPGTEIDAAGSQKLKKRG